MAGGRGLGKEVIQGVGGALIAIVIAVTIGSLIAQSLSHGPQAPAEETKTEAAEKTEGETTGAAEEAPKEEARAKEGEQ